MNVLHRSNTLPHRPGTMAVTLLLTAAAALLSPRATAADWSQNADPGGSLHYVRLEDIRSFYKFAPDTLERKSGVRRVSNGSTTLTFGPGPREMSLHGVRLLLSHPAKVNEKGEFILSKTDIVKLLDPVLRPTYIAKRREVKTVVIDPGHGGHDVGQQTPQVREADCTLSLARQLATQLQQRGYETILTREDNRYLSDQQRIDRANTAANAIFLSLHLNSGRSDYHGIETYTVTPYAPVEAAGSPAPTESQPTPPAADGATPMPGNEQDAANTALAFALQSALIHATGTQDGGCRRTRYSLLSSVRCPAAIVELGYATHEEEGAALNTEEYRSTLATALANGVDAFARAIKPGARPPVTAAPPPPPPTPVKVDKPAQTGGKKADSSKSGKKTSNKGKTIRKSKTRSKARSGSSGKRTGRKR